MRQDLFINLVPLELKRTPFKIYISRHLERASIQVQASLLGGGDGEYYGCRFSAEPGFEEREVSNDFRLLKELVRACMRKFFVEKGLIIKDDFIQRLCVYKFSHENAVRATRVYKKFLMRVIAPREQHAAEPNSWHISVAYDGETEVTNASLRSIGAAERLAKYAVTGSLLKRVSALTEDERMSEGTKAVLSRELRAHLGLSVLLNRSTNKYKRFYEESKEFEPPPISWTPS